MTSSNTLWYDSPAKIWTYALPLGNGHIGAMVYGGTADEKISLNHDELWSGVPNCGYHYKDGDSDDRSEYFFKARKLVLEGKRREAQDVLENKFCGNWTQAYLPLGDLNIHFDIDSDIKEYKRSLDISSALNTVSFISGGIKISRECFVSAKKNALVMNIKNNSDNGICFEISLTSALKHTITQKNDAYYMDVECPAGIDCENNDNDPEKFLIYSDDEKGISSRSFVKVIDEEATITYTDEKIIVKGSKNAVLIFSAETNFVNYSVKPGSKEIKYILRGQNYDIRLLHTMEKCTNSSYSSMREEHIKDHRKYYNRVDLQLCGRDMSDVPTDERLRIFQKDKNDKELYALIFNYGRYLTIAASRVGTQPMNLQGIWNDKIIPPWNCNYTININTEMNYWPTLICNMSDLNNPLIELIYDLSEAGEKTAQDFYHAKGFVSHHNTDIWRHTAPVPGNSCWSFWPMSSGWLCHHLFEHYEYTDNTYFLSTIAYPIMKKAAEFYLDLLVADKDGYLILAPSTSPENQFFENDEKCAVSETSVMTMSIIKELFYNLIQSCSILGKDEDFSKMLKRTITKLLPYKIGKEGQLLEWYNEEEETEVNHRHVSHLYGLYPGNIIFEDKMPELFNACKKSLEIRGDNGTGWSLGWKINLWARLGDGNHSLKLLNNQLNYKDELGVIYSGGGTYPNLFDAHPPFQIDGNFAATSGIAEMLLRSTRNEIHILPALPDSWKNGSVKGLKAKRNITVSFSWENGKVKDIKFSKLPKDMKVYYGNELIERKK